jgi:hypothetical protein
MVSGQLCSKLLKHARRDQCKNKHWMKTLHGHVHRPQDLRHQIGATKTMTQISSSTMAAQGNCSILQERRLMLLVWRREDIEHAKRKCVLILKSGSCCCHIEQGSLMGSMVLKGGSVEACQFRKASGRVPSGFWPDKPTTEDLSSCFRVTWKSCRTPTQT